MCGGGCKAVSSFSNFVASPVHRPCDIGRSVPRKILPQYIAEEMAA